MRESKSAFIEESLISPRGKVSSWVGTTCLTTSLTMKVSGRTDSPTGLVDLSTTTDPSMRVASGRDPLNAGGPSSLERMGIITKGR